ncbi:hypothetical protein CCACVL1_05534 [Corchorus capsularis]|uniref:Uncharacterized protein n=1 Tax=Corchorus capsularis TaxID=210143 RepID=A0A1R3JJX2_COCAP|nr:hypothetical protein CCACVL1_05534 [Corchorus capsularis]
MAVGTGAIGGGGGVGGRGPWKNRVAKVELGLGFGGAKKRKNGSEKRERVREERGEMDKRLGFGGERRSKRKRLGKML